MSRSKIYKLLEENEIELIVRHTFNRDTLVEMCGPLGGGLFNTTYYVQTLHPSKKLVLRVAPVRQELLFDFEKRMMEVEPLLYPLLHENGVPVPKVLKYDKTRSIIPRDYLITEYIEGSIRLNDPDFPNEYREHIQYELGVYTAKIHSIKADRFGWPNPDNTVNEGSEHWADIVLQFAQEITKKKSDFHVFDDSDIRNFSRFFDSNRSLFDINETPSLVHNDLWAPNILVKQTEGEWTIAAIIDADRAMYADREFEFVLWGNEPHFMHGYGRNLDLSPNAIVRRKAYSLMLSFFGTYVYKVQYDNEAEYRNSKNGALSVLQELRQME